MSPRAALQNPVALFYIAVALGLLLGAGLLLGVLRWRLGNKVGHAWQSYRGWLLIIPLTGVALFLGRETAVVFFPAVALLGFREFARATGLSADRYLSGGVCVGILAAGVAALVPDPAAPAEGWYDLFMTL